MVRLELTELLSEVDAHNRSASAADELLSAPPKPQRRGVRSSASTGKLPPLGQPTSQSAPRLTAQQFAWTDPGRNHMRAAAATASATPAQIMAMKQDPTQRMPKAVEDRDPAGIWSSGGALGTPGGSRAKLLGTAGITASLGYSLRDLSLARVGTAEGWLEDMLELPAVGDAEETGLETLRGLERAGLGRAQLQAEGLTADETAKLHQLLFVYSIGLHHSLSSIVGRLPPEPGADVAVRWWRTLVSVAERLLRTQLRTELLELLHEMEGELSDAQRAALAAEEGARRQTGEMQAVLHAALRVTDKSAGAAAQRDVQLRLLKDEVSGQEAAQQALAASLERAEAARWSAARQLQAAQAEVAALAGGGGRRKQVAAPATAARPSEAGAAGGGGSNGGEEGEEEGRGGKMTAERAAKVARRKAEEEFKEERRGLKEQLDKATFALEAAHAQVQAARDAADGAARGAAQEQGQSGRLGEATAGHQQLMRVHLQA